jgi:hypothetical protein
MLPGFERVSLESHYRRFCREAATTAPSYGVTFACGTPHIEDGQCRTSLFDLDTEGPGWHSRAEIVFYDLACLNAMYDRRPWPLRFLRGFGGVLDLLFCGVGLRYLRDGWRFFLFFLFPFFFLAAVLALIAVAALPPTLVDLSHLAWSLPLALAGGAALYVLAKRMHVPLMMDLWALTADVPRCRHPGVHRMLKAVGDDISARIAATTADEVIVVGHSFGAVPAIMALADTRVAQVAQQRPVGLLAAGSYLLAVAHHPAAKALREAARRVLRSPVAWLDAQSHTDPINFFRTNPADALRVDVARRPSIVEVRFKQQLEPASYRQIRGDFFRTHRQFVYGVEKRSHYSLFAIIGGPERFADVAARGGLSPDWTRFSVAEVKSRAS